MLTDAHRRKEFGEKGYLVSKGILNPPTDLGPLEKSYSVLIGDLARRYVGETKPDAISGLEGMSLPRQFAVLVGASRGAALHHLDPALNIFAPSYQWRGELPDPRPSELFSLIRHARLLDAMEGLIGPEIFASPLYHFNFKLAQAHLQLIGESARAVGVEPARGRFYAFQMGRTRWHCDAMTCMPDAHDSKIVNAWIPLTPATEENGCLMVVPGSHKLEVRHDPHPDALYERAITLPAEPGDVIFIDNRTLHCSLPNASRVDYRWAFNFRYLPTGQASGRPFLPGFVARSRKAPETELHDARTWSDMWISALDFLSHHGIPTSYEDQKHMSLEEAREITRRWAMRASDPEGWLNLGQAAAMSTRA